MKSASIILNVISIMLVLYIGHVIILDSSRFFADGNTFSDWLYFVKHTPSLKYRIAATPILFITLLVNLVYILRHKS